MDGAPTDPSTTQQASLTAFRRRLVLVLALLIAAMSVVLAASAATLTQPDVWIAVSLAAGTVWMAWRGRLGVAMMALSILASGLAAWGQEWYPPPTTTVPLYLLLFALVALLVVDQPLHWAVAGGLVVAMGGLRLRILSAGIEPVERWIWPTHDLMMVATGAVVLIGVYRHRWDRDQTSLVEALRRNVSLARQAQDAAEAARSASEAKSEFLARMSHELRTPLNAILGYADLLQELELIDPEGEPDLGRIRKAGENLLQLVDEVLDLTRVEAGKTELLWEWIDPEALVAEVTDTVRPLIDHSAVALRVELDCDGPVVLDQGRTRQILLNLLSNAVRFTEKGQIDIIARCTPSELVVAVRDTGIGIRAERLPHLFQPFTQAERDTAYRYGGTGLGLALCDRFVRLMGGRIDVRSELGRGSTFTVTLPCRDNPSAETRANELEASEGSRAPAAS